MMGPLLRLLRSIRVRIEHTKGSRIRRVEVDMCTLNPLIPTALGESFFLHNLYNLLWQSEFRIFQGKMYGS